MSKILLDPNHTLRVQIIYEARKAHAEASLKFWNEQYAAHPDNMAKDARAAVDRTLADIHAVLSYIRDVSTLTPALKWILDTNAMVVGYELVGSSVVVQRITGNPRNLWNREVVSRWNVIPANHVPGPLGIDWDATPGFPEKEQAVSYAASGILFISSY